MTNLIVVDEVLTEKVGVDSEDYKDEKDRILRVSGELSSKILDADNNSEIVHFVARYFASRKVIPDVEEVLYCISDLSSDEVLKYLPLMLSVKLKEFIAPESEVKSFFNALASKAKFAAADLGDENNDALVFVAVEAVNASFNEEINLIKLSGIETMSEVITEEFKTNLWSRVDRKIEFLKTLKEEVFSDEGLLDFESELDKATDGISVAQRKTETVNINSSNME